MKQVWPIFILGLLLAAPAGAGETVRVTRQDCQRLIRHVPSADAAYQPGVDVKGRKVAPADLAGSGNDIKLLPEVLQFNININPVDYQARNALAKQKADTQKAIVDNQTAKTAAETQVTTLTAQQATLVTQAATLAAELVPLQATLAPLQAEVTAGTRKATSPAYATALAAVTAKQAEIATNTASQTSVAASITTQQAIVTAAPATETSLKYTQTSIEAQQSALSAKGLDNTSMSVAAIKYDIARNKFFINDQLLGSAEMDALAEACAKAGVK
ncbi:MAG: hypothetical protein EPN26_06725 [Rhodospirillales bacterium]|nr:MAG: hypothetical protein EPN26_06725 [Rhodospirillales bacterium]